MSKIILKQYVTSTDPQIISDFLSLKTDISKIKIKKAMNNGSVWLKRKNKKQIRIRKATTNILPGDYVELYYDESLQNISPPESKCLSDNIHYSVWHKPSGLMSQGTMFGDHCSILYQAERFFSYKYKIFLVHRLDREVEGVMVLAHSKEAAAKFSILFKNNQIIKTYRASVLGNVNEKYPCNTINLPLDGKEAITEFKVIHYDFDKNSSIIDITIKTGRFHQIRRHFDMIGCPVIGDPKYGKGNKSLEGIMLKAIGLKFLCPFLRKDVIIEI
ncbi:MAG: RluA family pseudouridine synthase [Desulfobacterales bacterium]|nr:RluA family pseudouridine synthase [Desulfobacterales bacterium]